jgi:signal transduction histidine kinase/ligand-binding sensor domain-containing protein/CheY-like chemotaxis protein
MTYPRPSLFLLAVSFLASVAEAGAHSDIVAALQTPDTLQSRVRFTRVTTADGLSNDSVFSILQDHHGFLWFGTQAGLNRYDGYQVKQYRHDPRNPNSLSRDFVNTLMEDSRGAIWAGHPLSRFNPQTEAFTRFALPANESSAGKLPVLQAFREDWSGLLWLGLSGGRSLYRLDPNKGEFSAFDIAGTLPGRENIAVRSMYRDRNGILWIGANTGLIRFDPSNRGITHYPLVRKNRLPVNILDIVQDNAGNLWLATNRDTANFFDPVAGSLSRRWPEPDRQGPDDPATAIFAGNDGVLWQGTPTGLEVFDPASGAFAVLRHNASDRYSLSGNEILSIAQDRDGGLWIGTKEGGVSHLAPDTLRFGAWRRNPDDPHSLSDQNVRAIYRDRGGVLWIGTYNGGVNRYDALSGTFTHFRHDARNPVSLDSDRVYSIYEDRSGDLWVGTAVGINRLDRRTGTFAHFKRGALDAVGFPVPTYWFFEDSRSVFWFGAGPDSRASLDRRTGTVASISNSVGLSLHEDRDGNFWFGTPSGLTRRDPSGRLHTFAWPEPTGVQINFVHEDKNGVLWLATETGLLRFDPKTKAYSGYTVREGLPDNVVQCILGDKSGNLWLSTNNGISRFNPFDNSFVNYHGSDGLQGEQFNRKACSVDASGIMYFGGLQGFNMFDPDRIPARPLDAGRIVMTEFRVHGKNVPVQAGSVLPRPIWELDSLHLSHKDEEFSIEFAALGYRDQARTRYRFRLDGLESRWTEVDSRNRSARYTGVSPGNYRFRVQASRDGRTWSGPETSIALSIAPPWWMTPLSRGGAMLIAAGLLFGGYRWRVRALYQRGLQLEKLVDQRTAELIEARNQAEQANRAKSVFLANMSHELRTPLNAILGFSNLLSERSTSEEERCDLDIINRSGEHLLTLINDVLDVAKIEAGRTVLEISPCDLKVLVRDVTDMMRVRAAEKQLALVLVESGESMRYVLTDAAKLREVLINLLGNAIRYTERGSITLRFGAQPVSGEGERVLLRFEVEDTGIGIAREDEERIFQPFEQVASGGRQKGTGLGLAITRQVIELMGGSIELKSTPGKGSCFKVELTLDRTEKFETKPFGRERILGLEPDQPEHRILIVEDEPENWMVLQRLLENAGFQVRVAENGENALAIFRQWRPQFIWMDLRMPGMNGIEAVQRIRVLEGGRDAKIVAVTASGFESQRNDVLASGLDDYVRKPYRPDEIFQCMARHLGIRYRCAHAPLQPEAQISALSPVAIALLPAALRIKLRNALMTLDSKVISETINEVAEHDAVLGSVLAQYANTCSYSPILNAVNAVKEQSTASND